MSGMSPAAWDELEAWIELSGGLWPDRLQATLAEGIARILSALSATPVDARSLMPGWRPESDRPTDATPTLSPNASVATFRTLLTGRR
ncbi:MAG: hypothetical protein AAFZ07_20220 [Actinomycetota bacterium]